MNLESTAQGPAGEAGGAASTIRFSGFGNLPLVADAYGSADDPAVVLLHSAGQSRRTWRAAARALSAAGRYVLALDLRGHGDSGWSPTGRYDLDTYAQDLRAVLAQLPIRPVVVGASLGGLIAMAALDGEGEALASGLVLVDATPWMDVQASAGMGAVLRRHGEGFADLEAARAAAAELSPGRFPTAEALLPHLRREPDGRYYWRWDPRVAAGVDMANLGHLAEATSRLSLPLLIMHGEESQIVTDEAISRFREVLPSAEFVEVEGAGHLVAADRLDAFNAALLEFMERRLPRAPLSFESGSDPRVLRDALGCFGTGVIIAAALDPAGQPIGLTANSFTSVSLDPPLVLFCLANSAGSLPTFDAAKAYSVNVLHIGQQPTSMRFAKRGEARFEVTPWEQWETGAPIITGSLASIECEPYGRYDAGDHVVFIGKVVRARFEPRRDPLLFFRGKYRRLHLL
ncbi:MAG: flavin reductase-like, FMN-binding [Phenylobacterium sp.]|nr:flavin reductase-like, FMN-binding [Phenylobacterium sp.]